ncbi:MAG TPA: glycosyltransferase family 39 protein [Limnobacter sp.]|uniref:ArnT family glycosyltransferase n=1 Tax=Limnobacter sp. TaxID=2003368 RepID=UPI002EDAF6DB
MSNTALGSSPSVTQARQTFWIVVLVTAVLKLWLAHWFPMTSDEAFFYLWAKFPNWGYYDHPPMIGWWLWVLDHLEGTPLVVRSATVLLTTVIAFGVVALLKRLLPAEQEAKAWLGGAVYLSLPVSWYGVFVTTDTPLIFFMALAVFTYVLAVRKGSHWGVFFAGAFTGLAFLSKYFAVLLGIAFVLHLLLVQRSWRMLLCLAAGGLPFAFVNIAYNAFNCWNNIMFNLVNRHEDAHLGWQTVATYIGMMLYVLSPWAVWAVVKGRAAWKGHSALVAVLWVPLALFLFISLEKTIGLHWVLGFVPTAFVLLGLSTSADQMGRFVRWNAVLAVPHVVLFALLMHASPNIWKSSFRDDVVFHRQTDAVLKGLTADMPQGAVLTTVAYSPASLLTYHYGQVVPVFGPGKYHARNDDVFVDWRQMAGKDIRIVAKDKPIDPTSYQPYFESSSVKTETIEGIPFTVVDGHRFNYEKFRDVVLREAVTKYYKIPNGLPVFDCPFGRKYGFEAECRIGDMGVLKSVLK